VLVVGVIVLAVHLSGPHTLPEKLGDLIVHVTPNPHCLDGQASIETVRAADRPDLYPDLLPAARSAHMVACEHLGAVSLVVEFRSRAELERALGRSRSARRRAWCEVGAGAFDGKFLDRPTDLARFCRELHGTLRPATTAG
jgi:hypothetical protein